MRFVVVGVTNFAAPLLSRNFASAMIIARPSRSLSGERAGRNAADAAVADVLENVGPVGAGGQCGGGFDHQVVFVGTERAFVEPQHIAAFIVQGNGLQSIAGQAPASGLRRSRPSNRR